MGWYYASPVGHRDLIRTVLKNRRLHDLCRSSVLSPPQPAFQPPEKILFPSNLVNNNIERDGGRSSRNERASAFIEYTYDRILFQIPGAFQSSFITNKIPPNDQSLNGGCPFPGVFLDKRHQVRGARSTARLHDRLFFVRVELVNTFMESCYPASILMYRDFHFLSTEI